MGGSLIEPRGMHAAVRLADGRVLFVGGTNLSDRATSSSEIYDPTSGTFSLATAQLGRIERIRRRVRRRRKISHKGSSSWRQLNSTHDADRFPRGCGVGARLSHPHRGQRSFGGARSASEGLHGTRAASSLRTVKTSQSWSCTRLAPSRSVTSASMA